MSMPRGPGPDPGPEFVRPEISELSSFFGVGLRADSEQQQQQQQQQQHQRSMRRYLNVETQLPEEEVVSKLQTEVRQINKIAPRTE